MEFDNLTSLNAPEEYRDPGYTVFDHIQAFYSPIHGLLSLTVCIFGIITNAMNIIVLTRKSMLSQTNAILTGLAFADMLVMVEYIPFVIHSSIQKYETAYEKFSYPWAVYTLAHAHFSNIFHSISTWLTVVLAVWRYINVAFPAQSKGWCTMTRAKWTIVATYIAVPIVCFPLYMTYAIKTRGPEDYREYVVNYSEFTEAHSVIKFINFWVFAVALKIIPCILLTALILLLVQAMYRADERRIRLKSNGVNHLLNRSKASASTGVHSTPEVGLTSEGNNNLMLQHQSSLRANGVITHSASASPVLTIAAASSSQNRSSNQSPTHSGQKARLSVPEGGLVVMSTDDVIVENANGGDFEGTQQQKLIRNQTTSNPQSSPSSCSSHSSPGHLDINTKMIGLSASSAENLVSMTQIPSGSVRISSKKVVFKRFLSLKNSRKNKSKDHSVQQSSPGSHTQFKPGSAAHAAVKQSDRTTKMLLVILILFLITEFPSGILALMVGIYGDVFQQEVYEPLGEIFDALALINSSINFILYCLMSRMFRKNFCQIFIPARFHRSYQLNLVHRRGNESPSQFPNVTPETAATHVPHHPLNQHHQILSTPIQHPLQPRDRHLVQELQEYPNTSSQQQTQCHQNTSSFVASSSSNNNTTSSTTTSGVNNYFSKIADSTTTEMKPEKTDPNSTIEEMKSHHHCEQDNLESDHHQNREMMKSHPTSASSTKSSLVLDENNHSMMKKPDSGKASKFILLPPPKTRRKFNLPSDQQQQTNHLSSTGNNHNSRSGSPSSTTFLDQTTVV